MVAATADIGLVSLRAEVIAIDRGRAGGRRDVTTDVERRGRGAIRAGIGVGTASISAGDRIRSEAGGAIRGRVPLVADSIVRRVYITDAGLLHRAAGPVWF